MTSINLFANTVLITGANRGLGLEFAEQFKEKGYQVIGTARKPQEAEELKTLRVQVEQLDVTDPKSIQALKAKLKDTPIDILINNAGVFLDRNESLETLKPDQLSKTFAVNSSGPVMVTQALLPNLRKGKLKQIIMITSQLGSIENNSGGMYAYRASKAALNQFSKTMAIELAGEGFTVVMLHPGWVKTDMGGMAATFTPDTSIKRMIQVIDELTPKDNGRYLDLNGMTLPW